MKIMKIVKKTGQVGDVYAQLTDKVILMTSVGLRSYSPNELVKNNWINRKIYPKWYSRKKLAKIMILDYFELTESEFKVFFTGLLTGADFILILWVLTKIVEVIYEKIL